MTQYIQYDEEGNITATVASNGPSPDHPRQIASEIPLVVTGKKVDVATGELVDAPEEEPSSVQPAPPPEA